MSEIIVLTVASLLTTSRAAHTRAQGHRKRKRMDEARTALIEAESSRLAAHVLDPEHTHQAWAAEQSQTPVGRDTHTEMLAFYARELSKS